MSSSGGVTIKGWVEIGGKVSCSGKCLIQSSEKGTLKIGELLETRGGCTMEGNTVIA